ncbi:MAG: MGMT family protein [Acidobacteria bacterium]|nr:MGMT family protein [Acidobacteriota bacterium]
MTHQSRPSSFADRVYAVVRAIPSGRVATYGDVAEAAGRPGAARAVGTLMATSGPRRLPAHRVVAAGGALGGYGGHQSEKAALLRAEGVVVVGRRIREFAKVRMGPATCRPVLPSKSQ